MNKVQSISIDMKYKVVSFARMNLNGKTNKETYPPGRDYTLTPSRFRRLADAIHTVARKGQTQSIVFYPDIERGFTTIWMAYEYYCPTPVHTHPLVGLRYPHRDGGEVEVIEVGEESGRALVMLPDGRDHGVDMAYLEDIARRQCEPVV